MDENTRLKTDVSFQCLLDLVNGDEDGHPFERVIGPLLPDFIHQRKLLQASEVETDAYVCTPFYACKDDVLMNQG